ncbi:WD40-repeat-containing domain protein [Hyaloraphidium curvatum]|nr:WD40-repeat-containing domain protein [Hyaloraphidium curvatum]
MFRLSCSLKGHEGDVRAVAGQGSDLICSGSRDTTVRTWRRSSPNSFALDATLPVHSDYVNAVATIPPSSEFPEGLLLSAGKDKIIYATDPASKSKEPLFSMIGHTENVCALALTPSGHVVSGSWDKTGRLWVNWQTAYTMEGHTQAVWAVLGLTDEDILTASADKTVRRWKQGKTVHVYKGHTDAVRGVAGISSSTFASCSNDGTLRVWTLAGDCLQELHGHTSFVYGIASLGTDELVSCGEDRTVRVWSGGENTQTINHPCTSVWAVAVLSNGDVVSGGSDGAVRVFTRSDDRAAESQTVKVGSVAGRSADAHRLFVFPEQEYEEAVASHAIPSKQLGDIDKTKLKTVDALKEPGSKEGEVKMVRNGDQVEVYQWAAAEGRWQKVGEVVDAIGQDRKQIYEGREYDYVFDVQLSETGPPLKLPFNVSENPWAAAQDFIWRHELPQSFLDQIANFISSNVEGVQMTANAPPRGDPFTGGGRYVPGSTSAPAAARAPAATSHPFLSPNAYSTSAAAASGAATPAAAATALIPMRDYTFFKTANTQAVLTKILQLNADLEKDMDTASDSLSAAESHEIDSVATKLKGVATAKPFPSAFTDNEVAATLKVALQWPDSARFPGLDLLRLMVLMTPRLREQTPLDVLQSVLPKGDSLTKDQETNLMLALRFFCNLFASSEGQNAVRELRSELLQLVQRSYQSSTNKNLRLAAITLILNLSVLGKDDSSSKMSLVEMVLEFLKAETDSENCFRGMVALGTLASIIDGDASAKAAAESSGAATYVRQAGKVTGADETKLKKVEAELLKLLN